MKVKIFTTPTCPFCNMTKQLFKEHNVKYQEVDVASNIKAREEMFKKSGQMGVPVIEIDGKIVIGYDEPALRKLLKIK